MSEKIEITSEIELGYLRSMNASQRTEAESESESSSHSSSSDLQESTNQSNIFPSNSATPKMPRYKGSNYLRNNRALIIKNILLFKRNPKLLLFQMATPIFFCMLLLYLQTLIDDFTTVIIHNPQQNGLNLIQKCTQDHCHTITYSIIGNEDSDSEEYDWIHETMEYVSLANKMEYGKDVKFIGVGNSSYYYDYLEMNPNRTVFGVVFCTSHWELYKDVGIPCTFDKLKEEKSLEMKLYVMFYNKTLAPDGFMLYPNIPVQQYTPILKLKESVDNGIISAMSKRKNISVAPEIEITTSSYPLPSDRFMGTINIVTSTGACYLFIPPLLVFAVLMIQIITEKSHNLRLGLMVMGVSSASYWTCWVITGLFFCICSTIILLITGYICHFEFFLNTPLLFSFTLFLLFSLAMLSIGFCLTTLISSEKLGYTITFTFVLLGLVLQSILADTIFVYFIFYQVPLSTPNYIVRSLFSLYPPFPFAKCFGDIARISSSHYESTEAKWGREVTWNDIFSRVSGHVVGGEIPFAAPSPFESLLTLVYHIIAYGCLAWYFDNICASNRGCPQRWYFFLTGSYWRSWFPGCKNEVREESIERGEEDLGEDEPSLSDVQNVEIERERIMELEREDVFAHGIRVAGIKKAFNPGCVSKQEKVEALKGLYLSLEEHEVLALLGQNGAGKTTLINILTGIVPPTAGRAKIYNMCIRERISEIRKLIGVVPQFDLLWDDLTCREQIELIATIKCIPPPDIPRLIKCKLSSVKLLEVENVRVSKLSGGMRRRLSVCLSSIGFPKVIIMDEPSTGMDPINKRHIWKMVQKLKKSSSILLTTHQMEEADVLSDSVAIIVDGQLFCLGSSLYLKNHYGDGYRVTLMANTGTGDFVHTTHFDICKQLIPRIFPQSKFILQIFPQLVFTIPMQNTLQIALLFKLIGPAEEGDEENELVKEFRSNFSEIGVSHTTLQDVFTKVINDKSI